MVYIVVLNWNGFNDTIACLGSLFKLTNIRFRIVICDNLSADDSYFDIRDWILENKNRSSFLVNKELVELDLIAAGKYVISDCEDALYLIQTGSNLGYAGGNNVGIRFAMNQPDMRYVWILNNDTEVEPSSLFYMVNKCDLNPNIGICGSKLIYNSNRSKLQGLGGIYNPWLCTTKHYAAFYDSTLNFNDERVADEIDYIIGASMLLTKPLLDKIGLLCEDYFLYYEELDLALRMKNNFSIGVSTDSIVYHKEGASTGGKRSALSDYYSVRNRVLITKKFHPEFLPIVIFSLLFVIVNRLRRLEFKKAWFVFKLMLREI